MKILFVCMGNTCRSPMAEGIYNALCKDGEKAQSRGLMATTPLPASDYAIEAMKKRGIDISEKFSKQFTFEDLKSADVIYTMTKEQRRLIGMNSPAIYMEKVFTLADEDIPDPYGGDEEEYEECAKKIEEYVRKIIDKNGN